MLHKNINQIKSMTKIFYLVFLLALSPGFLLPLPAQEVSCEKEAFYSVGSVKIYDWVENKSFYFYTSKMSIDADGSPRAYHPKNIGIDELSYAGRPGNWWALVTDDSGEPLIQGEDQPYPGYYISTTSLVYPGFKDEDPLRYVNSEVIPYFVLPSDLLYETGTTLGDIGYVYNIRNGKGCFAIYADTGSEGKIGEGSMYLAKQLGINDNPRTGGQADDVLYIIFPYSGYKQPLSIDKINTLGKKLQEKSRMQEFLEACFKN